MKVVVYLRSAQRDMDKLPPRTRDQIETKLARYAATGAGDVKALVGEPGARLRSGDYRVVFTESGDAITVRAVRNRRDVYRR